MPKTPDLTPAEKQALRYQSIVARYEPGCECPPCRAIALVIDLPLS